MIETEGEMSGTQGLSYVCPISESISTNTTQGQEEQSTEAPSTVAITNQQSLTIYSLSRNCLNQYQTLCETLHHVGYEQAKTNGYDRNTAFVVVQDMHLRFKSWATGIAALQQGHIQSSLDSRLNEAMETKQIILKILENLKESLYKAHLIASCVEINEKWEVGSLSDLEADDKRKDEPIETSELDELLSAIKATNSSLMKLSIIIRNSPSRDDYLKAATRYSWDPKWDINHVREKFGSANKCSEWLIQRLGKAITRRRQYLIYRKEHHLKLSRDWGDEMEKETIYSKDDENPETTAHTKATTFTSYQQTNACESPGYRLTVPPPPKEAFDGIPFEYKKSFQCPYCRIEQVVENKAAWKQHVFHDLRPYVCLFKECNLRMYSSRNEWFAHELQKHRREWTCPACSETTSSKSKFSSHLLSAHYPMLGGSELEALVLQSEEPIDKFGPSACKLCDKWESDLRDPKHNERRLFLNKGNSVKSYGTLAQFRRHLGRHMEELALFALPMNEENDIEDGNDDDSNYNRALETSKESDISATGEGAEPEFFKNMAEHTIETLISDATGIEWSGINREDGLPEAVIERYPFAGLVEPLFEGPEFSKLHLPDIIDGISFVESPYQRYSQEQLTTYEVYTIQPKRDSKGNEDDKGKTWDLKGSKDIEEDNDPRVGLENMDKGKESDSNSKNRNRWEYVEISQESYPKRFIFELICKLDRDKPVYEKMECLSSSQKTHISNILDSNIIKESVREPFEWSIAQLHVEEAYYPITGSSETVAITVFLKRAPPQDPQDIEPRHPKELPDLLAWRERQHFRNEFNI